MAATGTPTPNLGLRIPVGTDPASVDDINYNSNLLDTVLGAVGNTSVKDQLDGLSDQIAAQFNTAISDLNTPLNEGKSVITFNVYGGSASNRPTANTGFVITFGNTTYRQQIAFELAGEIYSRYYNNGTISAWVKRST